MPTYFPRTSRAGLVLLLLESQRAAATTNSLGILAACTRALIGLVLEQMPGLVLRIAAVLKMPQLQPFPKNVSLGQWHSLLLSESGHALSCGRGDEGRLGHGDEKDQPVPRRIAALRNVRIVQVSAGYHHSLMLAHCGRVFSCGLNTYGQLGLGLGDKRQRLVPTAVALPESHGVVQHVAAGALHSMFLTREGRAFSCGWNVYGQLGLGHKSQSVLVPTAVRSRSPQPVRFVQLAGALTHSLFLAIDGAVFSCGFGPYGALGHGDREDQTVPKKIESPSLENVRVAKISASGDISLLLAASGRVFACGDNCNGQLGLGDLKARFLPEAVTGLDSFTIIQIAAGWRHSLFLTSRGQVLACGERRRTPLAHAGGGSSNQLVPRIVESLARIKISQIAAAGPSGSLFLEENGQALQALVSGPVARSGGRGRTAARPDCRYMHTATRDGNGGGGACVEPVIFPS